MALSLNILIVEPSADLRIGLRNRLEDMEQNVQSAASSAEALALLEWHGMPDLILSCSPLARKHSPAWPAFWSFPCPRKSSRPCSTSSKRQKAPTLEEIVNSSLP